MYWESCVKDYYDNWRSSPCPLKNLDYYIKQEQNIKEKKRQAAINKMRRNRPIDIVPVKRKSKPRKKVKK